MSAQSSRCALFLFYLMSKVKDQNFFVIHGWMLNQLELKGNELLIYALIYGFSQDGESKFRGSLAYISDFAGCSKSTCSSALNSLVEKGYIVRVTDVVNGVTFNKYSAVPPHQKSVGGIPETEGGGIPKSGTNNNSLDSKEEKIVMPFASEEFISKWKDWIDYKKEQHKFTYKSAKTHQSAVYLLFEESNKDEATALKMLDRAMIKGWKGWVKPEPVNMFQELTEEEKFKEELMRNYNKL